MLGFMFGAAGGGAAVNNIAEDISYEHLGFAANGTPVTVTAAASANTKGSYITIGTPASNWKGFWLLVGDNGTNAHRFLIDIRVNSATIVLPDYFLLPGNTTGGQIFIPLNITAGQLIECRCQSSTLSGTIGIALAGQIASTSTPPMFNTCTALNIDTAATRPSTINVPVAVSVGSYTQLLAATAATYGAISAAMESNGTAGIGQQVTGIVGYGPNASETQLGRFMGHNATTPLMPRSNMTWLKNIPSGTRLAAQALGATAGDNVRIGLYGFA